MKQKKIAFCYLLFIYFSLSSTSNAMLPDITDTSSSSIDQEYIDIAKNFKKNGEIEKSIRYFKRALEINPSNKDASFELANTLYGEKQYDEALHYFKKVCELDNNCSQAFFNTGLCLTQINQINEAISYLKNAIEINPEYTRAYKQLGTLLHKNKQYDEAVTYFEKLLQLHPESFDIIYQLGKSLKAADRLEDSIIYLEKAFEKKPDELQVIFEVANTYNMLNRNQESLDLYKKILETHPDLYQILYNYAFTLKKMGHYEESIKIYKKILEKNPKYAQAHFSIALAHLALGDFKTGWPEYEWRWAAYNETPKRFVKPLWNGSDPYGKTIFIYAEQGLGDTFQFIRYAEILHHLGAKVIFEAQKPVAQILTLCPYIETVIKRGDDIPEFDYYIPLMSLPLIFKTDIDTIPANIPYLFADPQLEEYWKEQLSTDKNFKIGICWQGNPSYRTQALRHAVAAKSMHVSIFEPIANIPGVSLYCLQKMGGEEQLKEINFEVKTFGADFDDSNGRFMDTAAVIKNLDLVITVDTSIAHFAAGLGTKTWIMLPEPADWRWLVETTKTPWYPHTLLFRQPTLGDWETVISDITKTLKALRGVTEKTTIQTKSQQKKSTHDTIMFVEMEDVVFEELLDKLLVLTIKYDDTKDPELLKELKEEQSKIKNLENLYNTTKAPGTLKKLTQELFEINKKLWNIEKAIIDLGAISIFDETFTNLMKKAEDILSLKIYIKNQIKELVTPDAC